MSENVRDTNRSIAISELYKSIVKSKTSKKSEPSDNKLIVNITTNPFTTVIIYVLCHSGNESEADNFCYNMNTNISCVYKKHKLKQTKYFENDFYLWWLENEKIELEANVKWIGIIVPHYRSKIKNNIDFYQLSKNMGNRDYIGLAGCNNDNMKTHPGAMSLLNKTLKEIELSNKTIQNMRVSYFNYWLMSVEALKDYSIYVKKIYNLWEGIQDEESLSDKDSTYVRNYLRLLMNGNSSYPLRKINSVDLMEKTGFSYYTFHTFILERMHKIILTSLGYVCDINREYNPEINVIEANIYCPTNINITQIISNKIKNKLTFTVNSNLLKEILSLKTLELLPSKIPQKLTIRYTLGTKIIKTININYGERLIPTFI